VRPFTQSDKHLLHFGPVQQRLNTNNTKLSALLIPPDAPQLRQTQSPDVRRTPYYLFGCYTSPARAPGIKALQQTVTACPYAGFPYATLLQNFARSASGPIPILFPDDPVVWHHRPTLQPVRQHEPAVHSNNYPAIGQMIRSHTQHRLANSFPARRTG